MSMIYPLSFFLNLFKGKNSKGISMAYVLVSPSRARLPPSENALVLLIDTIVRPVGCLLPCLCVLV